MTATAHLALSVGYAALAAVRAGTAAPALLTLVQQVTDAGKPRPAEVAPVVDGAELCDRPGCGQRRDLHGTAACACDCFWPPAYVLPELVLHRRCQHLVGTPEQCGERRGHDGGHVPREARQVASPQPFRAGCTCDATLGKTKRCNASKTRCQSAADAHAAKKRTGTT